MVLLRKKLSLSGTNFMYMRTYIFILLFISLGGITNAQHRDVSDAQRIALEYYQQVDNFDLPNKINLTNNKNRLKIVEKYIQEKSPYYIFNDTSSNRFVIISGDERMKTILGSCNNHLFNPDEVPCGLTYLLSHYAKQFELVDKISELDSTKNIRFANAPTSTIEPLLTSKWDQESPYNDNCPFGCPSGCVATAMAQIMYYYKYPTTGSGQFSYTSRTNKYLRSYDYEHALFDWSNIQDIYSLKELNNSKSREAVANVLEACGVSVAMDYSRNGSGAYDTSIPYALINFFNYNQNVSLYVRDFYQSAEWYERVYEELTNKRPILYCGSSITGGRDAGHAFIIDGYRPSDGKFHVNWGWGGDYDDYYELDALDPPNGYKFSTGQSMIVNFFPDNIGVHEDVFYAEDFVCTNKMDIDETMNFILTGLENYSNSSSYVVPNTYFSGIIGIGLFDYDFNYIQSLTEKETGKMKTYDGSKRISFSVVVPSNIIREGEKYFIAPYVKSKQSDLPTRIRTIGGKTDYYIINKSGSSDNNDNQLVEKELLLSEDFESSQIPIGWYQEHIQGSGDWKGQLVLIGNEASDTPNPASGNGYAYLKYNSGNIFADIRTVTRLVSPILSGVEGQHYLLNLQTRKYSSQIGTTEIISVLIDRGCTGKWETLMEQSIANSNKWFPFSIPYTIQEQYRLAIEGSLEYGAVLFLDNARVTVVENGTDMVQKVCIENPKQSAYSLFGMKSWLHKGLNIVKNEKGEAKLVFIK